MITNAGSNPVFTIGPFVEPLPVYEPIDEYPATEAKQYAIKVPPLAFTSP